MLIWNGYLFEFNLREWFFLDYATTITTLVKPSKHHVQLGFGEINLFNDFHNNLAIREDGAAYLKHSWNFGSSAPKEVIPVINLRHNQEGQYS